MTDVSNVLLQPTGAGRDDHVRKRIVFHTVNHQQVTEQRNAGAKQEPPGMNFVLLESMFHAEIEKNLFLSDRN